MLRLCLFAILLLTACGRPLTQNEIAFADTLFGEQVDTTRVRFVDGHFAQSYSFRYQARPRVTCTERIYPPAEGSPNTITTSPGAISLFNTVYYRDDLFLEDYGYAVQGRGNLYALMLFAHEMTHVWQWQNRDRTRYHPLKAAREHTPGHDPYLFELGTQPDFLSFPYEQQGSIVEEYVCCRALAPQAARTKRLHQMLAAAMPVAQLTRIAPDHAFVPWKDVQLRGICD